MRAALHKKLLRDLVRLRGQVVTIALVLGCGIASFVALRGVFWSLEQARLRFYQRQRFADVFATLERAPERLHRVLQTIPGVERIQIRVVEKAMLPLADAPEPIAARVVSLPEAESLNAIQLREGRRPSAAHQDEVVLLAGFADAHHVKPGDQLPAIINGKLRKLRVVGTAASPEYIMAVSPGSFNPDPNRLAVIWMTAEAVLASFGMRGEFNDVALELVPGASEPGAIDAVDRVLAPYGGLGAYGRSRQPSHRMLSDKLIQLQSLSTVLPLIFLAVAALLVNVVLTRLIQLERSEIATLKAIGYSNARVGLHYLELVLAVGAPGVPLGVALGAYFGAQMVKLYTFYFRIPDLAFRLDGRDVLLAASVSVLSAMAGALSGVYRAVTLPPAEAMRPPSPARYRRGFSDWLGASALGPSAQMVVRELERRPLRAVLSVLAIAASTALSVVGGWYFDGICSLLDTQFHRAMREDILIAFTKPRPERAVRELAHLSGVRHAEGLRLVPVRLRSAHHYRDVVLWGYPDQSEMRQLRNSLGASVPLPADGLVLTDLLARILDVGVKDSIEVDFLEGSRGKRNLVVSGLVSEAFGLQAHMRLDALRRATGEDPLVSTVLLRTDPWLDDRIQQRLKELPYVAESTRRASLLEGFRVQSAGMIVTAALIISLFAGTITIGVVYNNARIVLSMRAREFATLRVLGFTRGEISAVLLGELGLQVLAALPLGLVLGRALVTALGTMTDPEAFRLPLLLTPGSYAFAASVTLMAATVSALLVRRRLDQLDLIGVLKARE